MTDRKTTSIIDTDTGLIYDLVDGVNTENIKPLAYYLIMLVGIVISKATGKTPALTDGWRDVTRQLKAMENMKATQPALYEEVYGPMMKRGQDPATMPHPEGRAGDWAFKDFEAAESKLLEVNDWMMEGAKELLGYDPSRLIYPEKSGGVVRCYHVQLPRQIPDAQKFRDYLAATFGRV